VRFGVYIVALEPISTAYFVGPPISLCVYVCPLIVARRRLSESVPRQRIHATIELFDA
jgi:hypothetical protein